MNFWHFVHIHFPLTYFVSKGLVRYNGGEYGDTYGGECGGECEMNKLEGLSPS